MKTFSGVTTSNFHCHYSSMIGNRSVRMVNSLVTLKVYNVPQIEVIRLASTGSIFGSALINDVCLMSFNSLAQRTINQRLVRCWSNVLSPTSYTSTKRSVGSTLVQHWGNSIENLCVISSQTRSCLIPSKRLLFRSLWMPSLLTFLPRLGHHMKI